MTTPDDAVLDDTALDAEQLTLPGMPRPRRRSRRVVDGAPVAAVLPVARVVLDVTPAHLDRPFDYLVPEPLSAEAQPGVRVRVRFGGKDVDGFVVGRVAESEHEGSLALLRRVVSPVPVAPAATVALCRAVADHYAGTLADLLRSAVPPRHARTEKTVLALPQAAAQVAPHHPSSAPVPSPWALYAGGPAFLKRVAAGESPRAVVTMLPDAAHAVPAWASGIAHAVEACLLSGRDAVVVAPDSRDVDVLMTALEARGLDEWRAPVEAALAAPDDVVAAGTTEVPGDARTVVRLEAGQGPSVRWAGFLAALTGRARVVVGTRAAAFAPVRQPGLLVCWDDDDSSHTDERAPRFHTREVLRLRTEQQGTAFLLAAPSRSLEAQVLLETGWARELTASRATVREVTPRVVALTSVETASEGPAGTARLPERAWRAVRAGLEHGPVLVQVPRSGYLPMVACAQCRERAECKVCAGPLRIPGPGATPQCAWCGALATRWRCRECGSTSLRSVRVGSARTAEELGRAFPQIPVRLSGVGTVGGVRAVVGAQPQLVVATPGAEPRAEGGYTVAALLDAAVATSHEGLGTESEALRRWLCAASLVRSAGAGGTVLLVGDAAPRPTNALVQWNPVGFAQRELEERRELSLPPAVRMVSIAGDAMAVDAFLAVLQLPDSALVLGPTPTIPGTRDADGPGEGSFDRPVRVIVRCAATEGAALARAVAAARVRESASRRRDLLRIELDPRSL